MLTQDQFNEVISLLIKAVNDSVRLMNDGVKPIPLANSQLYFQALSGLYHDIDHPNYPAVFDYVYRQSLKDRHPVKFNFSFTDKITWVHTIQIGTIIEQLNKDFSNNYCFTQPYLDLQGNQLSSPLGKYSTVYSSQYTHNYGITFKPIYHFLVNVITHPATRAVGLLLFFGGLLAVSVGVGAIGLGAVVAGAYLFNLSIFSNKFPLPQELKLDGGPLFPEYSVSPCEIPNNINAM